MKRSTTTVIAALAVLCALVGIVFAAELNGEGYTPSALHAGVRAREVVDDIENGRIDAAADGVGFWSSDDREKWVTDMQTLFSSTLTMVTFNADFMKADDGFVSGEATLQAIDRASGESYTFIFPTTIQQGGVVFGGGRVTAGDPERGEVLCQTIEAAMSTWNAG